MICSKSKEKLINFFNHLCRAWRVLLGTPSRSPASILGVLCRKWYPDIVELSLGEPGDDLHVGQVRAGPG
jgi:hypothetical protein